MKDKIIKLLKSTNRENILGLTNWLIADTDYFQAPASTKYHDSFEGGLAKHSLGVFNGLCDIVFLKQFESIRDRYESIVLCALLHDVCKTNFYKVSMRNKQNEQTGKWEKVPYYEIDDQEPYGHGEKSVMLIEKHIRLSDEERYAIRWHMGAWTENVNTAALNKAFRKYPLALALHIADMMASNLMGESK